MKTNLNQIISSTFSDKKQFEKYLKSKENCFVGWVDSYNAEMGYVNVLPAIQDEIVTQENVTIYKNKPFLINCWVIANTLNRNPQRGDKALLLVLDEKSNNFFKAQYSNTLPLEKQTSVNTSKAIKSKSNCVAIIVNPNYVSGSGQVSWGDIIGDLENQTDLINYLNQTYQTQIDNLQENLSTETTNRENADDNLQTQISNINTNLSNYVTISTNQTITGRKTFTKEIIKSQSSGYYGFRVNNLDLTRGEVTESNAGAGRLIFYDKNNKILGFVQQMILKDGTSQLQLSSQSDAGNATLYLNSNPDGTIEVYTDDTIRVTRGSTRYLDANNGAVPIVLDRTGGQFNMLANMKSTNGVFCFGTYQNRFMITYTSNETIEAGTNAVDKQWWFNEDGSLMITNNADASGTSYNGPALVIGGTQNQPHIEIDCNEIMAKSNATTPTSLFLNSDGGEVFIGNNTSQKGFHFVTGTYNHFSPTQNNGVSLGQSNYRWNNAYLTNLNVSGGTATVPTPSTTDNSTNVATTEWVRNFINNLTLSSIQQWTNSVMQINIQQPNIYNFMQDTNLQIGSKNIIVSKGTIGILSNYTGSLNDCSYIYAFDFTNNVILYGSAITSTIQEFYLQNDLNNIPTGTIVAFAGSTVPDGWLLCDGGAISRTTYSNLFTAIGTTYGSGNGSTTFNLPNLIDKFIEGSSTVGTNKSAGLPNITGELADNLFGNNVTNLDYDSGAFVKPTSTSNDRYINWTDTNREAGFTSITFNASKSNSIYGNSNTVQPPALTMQYIIKY